MLCQLTEEETIHRRSNNENSPNNSQHILRSLFNNHMWKSLHQHLINNFNMYLTCSGYASIPTSTYRSKLSTTKAPCSTQNHNTLVNQNNNKRKITHFDPIPMSYSQLFSTLIQKGLIVTRSLPPTSEPYPRGYKPNAHCKFH